MTHFIVPVINLNGNSAEDLVDKLKLVIDRLRDVEAAMADANDVCHGRNFQHLIRGRDTTRHVLTTMEAQQAWGERRHLISKIRDEVMTLALAIQAQGKREKHQ